MKKKVFTMLMAAALVLSLGACGQENQKDEEGNSKTEAKDTEEKPVELSLMAWDGGTGEATEVILHEIIDDFNKEYEGKIKIVPEYLPSEQTKTKLPTLMAANNAPDLFMSWSAGYLEPYVKAGKVYSLQEALDNDPEWKN